MSICKLNVGDKVLFRGIVQALGDEGEIRVRVPVEEDGILVFKIVTIPRCTVQPAGK
jgi:hypothetical protein